MDGAKPEGEESEERRVGWVIGEELDKVRGEEGWEEKYEQRWPFRATSEPENWEGRAYVL
jgi:hypothetical protein